MAWTLHYLQPLPESNNGGPSIMGYLCVVPLSCLLECLYLALSWLGRERGGIYLKPHQLAKDSYTPSARNAECSAPQTRECEQRQESVLRRETGKWEKQKETRIGTEGGEWGGRDADIPTTGKWGRRGPLCLAEDSVSDGIISLPLRPPSSPPRSESVPWMLSSSSGKQGNELEERSRAQRTVRAQKRRRECEADGGGGAGGGSLHLITHLPRHAHSPVVHFPATTPCQPPPCSVPLPQIAHVLLLCLRLPAMVCMPFGRYGAPGPLPFTLL